MAIFTLGATTSPLMGTVTSPCITGIGTVLKGVHTVAEGLLSTLALQPIFSVIDEPIIHPLLWSPLGFLTGVPVAEHPDRLGSTDNVFEQIVQGPGIILEGVGTILQGIVTPVLGLVGLSFEG
ncbi:MAG: hypothetical protein FWH56_08215 [Betaproteobacteria bacterium]|nr:hypothetical protein [Betaproteobacteria bacterium]